MFKSEVRDLGEVDLPAQGNVRVMMMPFRLDATRQTLPGLERWHDAVDRLVGLSPASEGIGYLTIDEAIVGAGECHRRPGLHVDGLGGWGGGGGPWGANGMLLAASVTGCRAWSQEVDGWPGDDGCCEHLRSTLRGDAAIDLLAGHVYWCGSLAVHESLAMPSRIARQIVRLSMPSPSPWFEGYTPNPCGVMPTGPVLQRRVAQMAYRSSIPRLVGA